MKQELIDFINISYESDQKGLTLFEWKPPQSHKPTTLDLHVVRENTTKDIFFHLNKGVMKIVYIRMGILLYTIGSDEGVQYQLMEALIEKVNEQFNEMYAVDVILSYGDVTPIVFKDFTTKVNEIIENAEELIKTVDVFCRVCKKTLALQVKKSLIKSASSFPVPVVYTHRGHAIVTYVDQNFVMRGVELVTMNG